MRKRADQPSNGRRDDKHPRDDRREPFEEPVLAKQESLTRITGQNEDFGGSGASGAAFF
jgi:hypothetical protein